MDRVGWQLAAVRWRTAAHQVRDQAVAVGALVRIAWDSPAADAYREVVHESAGHLLDLAEQHDGVADELERRARGVTGG